VLQQRQQRALAVVQGDVVEIVEHPRLGQFAQLGVDEAAAEHGDDGRDVRLDRLGDAEGAIDVAGKGRRDQHHLRRVAVTGFQGQVAQRASTRFGGAASAAASGSKVGWLCASDSA
jgi:hypothetical protein